MPVPVPSINAVSSTSSQVANASISATTTAVSGFPTLLSAHLPVSFAAAPAVSGSKANTQTAKMNESPSKEQKQQALAKPKDTLGAPLAGKYFSYFTSLFLVFQKVALRFSIEVK